MNRPVGIALMVAVVATGCFGPNDQSMVVRASASGQPMLVVGLCAGERVDAVRLRQGTERDGPVLWEVVRMGDETVREAEVGTVPAAFRTSVGLTGPLPAEGVLEAALSGGGVAITRSRFRADAVPELDRAKLDDLSRAADENCAQRPFRSPWWLTVLALGTVAGVFTFVLRFSGRSSRRPVPRTAWRSPLSYLSILFGLSFVGVLWPGSYGSRSETATYVLYGAVLGLFALGIGLLGRLARRVRFVEWLLVVPALFLALAVLLVGTVKGFLICGASWSFDCTTTLLERVALFACFIPAWLASVWVAEGGWWTTRMPTEHESGEARRMPDAVRHDENK